jgi:ABC-type multidrug transport system fused ATPase/permease subunit
MPSNAGYEGRRPASHQKKRSAALPRLMTGERRVLMAGLVCTGLGMAAFSAAFAFLMAWMLLPNQGQIGIALGGMAGVALALGTLRIVERVLAEKLAQHYVQQIRAGLIRHALAPDAQTSVGITIARTTNDLAGVRNWITLGLAPIIVTVPLILGMAIALCFLSPALAIAGVTPLVLLAAALVLLANPAFSKAREVRRRRGRLAAQIADTVSAAASIHAAGGTDREVRRIGRLGEQMVAAAVQQATIAGYLRASSAIAAAAAVAAVAGTGALLAIDTSTIAAGLTAAGMMSAPVSELGRFVEYRQKFLAARQNIAPSITRGGSDLDVRAATPPHSKYKSGNVRISDLSVQGRILPTLEARAGDRVLIHCTEPDSATFVCRALLGLESGSRASVCIDDLELLTLPPAMRRICVGYAAHGGRLERGSIARALQYRRPDLPSSTVSLSLASVGLMERVRALPEGERTLLRSGGEPLTRSERARLQLARALLGTPPLLVLDHLDLDLGSDGCALARRLLEDYPGVVIIASENPGALVTSFRVWEIEPPNIQETASNAGSSAAIPPSAGCAPAPPGG